MMFVNICTDFLSNKPDQTKIIRTKGKWAQVRKGSFLCFIFMMNICVFATEIHYYDSTKDRQTEMFVQKLCEAIKTRNEKRLQELFDTYIDMCPPGVLATNEEPMPKKDVFGELTEIPSINNISFYWGLLYDDAFSLREFGQRAYQNLDFSIAVNKEGIYSPNDGDYNVLIYYKERSLATIKFVIRKNRIMRVANDFISAYGEYDYPSNDISYFTFSNNTKMYDTSRKVIFTFKRNIKAEYLGDNKYRINGIVGYIDLREMGIVWNGLWGGSK